MDDLDIDKFNDIHYAGLLSFNAQLIIEQYYKIVIRLNSHGRESFPEISDSELREICARRTSRNDIFLMITNDCYDRIKDIDITKTIIDVEIK